MSKSLFAFRLRRFLALAPSLFRQDAVFRYAVIGGGLALLALLSHLGAAPAPAPVSAPAAALPPIARSLSASVPPSTSLRTEYGGAPESKHPPETVSHDPPRIAPSHSLDELDAAQNRRQPPDRFGVIPHSSSEKNWMPLPRRLIRLVSSVALVAHIPGNAFAEPPNPPRDAQLDRVEQKLDEVLKRIGAGGAPPAQTEKTPESETPSKYRPGALAIVHAAPASARLLAEVPIDSVGGFTYSGGPIALHDMKSRGVNFSGLAGIELQGWLKVKEAGRMQFVADLHGTLASNIFVPPECLLQIWLEDRLVGPERAPLAPDKNRDAKASMLIGAELEPGLVSAVDSLHGRANSKRYARNPRSVDQAARRFEPARRADR